MERSAPANPAGLSPGERGPAWFLGSDLTRAGVRRLAFARTVLKSWRALVPRGGRTLVACSGGADSTALLLALASATRDIVVGHVAHDMRAREEAFADRDFVRGLARRLGVAFVEREVNLRANGGKRGNAEGVARRLRYAALAEMAAECRCGFVGTAHHADDQMESMLMALVRGSGTAGLRGLATARRLGSSDIRLLRPMLGVTHAGAAAFCTRLGVAWREDATNADGSRLRTALRVRVLPVLEELRPGASARAARASESVRGAHAMLEAEADRLMCGARIGAERRSESWSRAALRTAEPGVIGEALRRAFARIGAGCGLDALPARRIDAAVRAVRSRSGEAKRFAWPGHIEIIVGKDAVTVRRGPERPSD